MKFRIKNYLFTLLIFFVLPNLLLASMPKTIIAFLSQTTTTFMTPKTETSTLFVTVTPATSVKLVTVTNTPSTSAVISVTVVNINRGNGIQLPKFIQTSTVASSVSSTK